MDAIASAGFRSHVQFSSYKKDGHMRHLILLLCAITWPGVALAGIAEGKAAYEKKDYEVALREFRTSAAQGDATAQAYLGNMYLMGSAVKQDCPIAVEWFRKSAKQGNAQGLLYLGHAYAEGKCVPRDYEQAMKFYKEARAKDDKEWSSWAVLAIGGLYESGHGVALDRQKALDFYIDAANYGNTLALVIVGHSYEKQTHQQPYPNNVMAYMYYDLAATIAPMHSYGAGERRDRLAGTMSPEQMAEAQALVQEWKAKYARTK